MNSDPIRANAYGADILRGVAILMVVAFHAFGPTWGYYVPWSGWVRDFSAAPSQEILWLYPVTFGWAGVSLFFVISGFCIHYSYLRSGRFDAVQFYWRRTWRLCPAYWIALLVFTVALGVNLYTKTGRLDILSHAFFFHNALPDTFFGINASFWSIAVEVQLYWLFPLLLVLRAKLGLAKAMSVLFVVGCLWRLGVLWLWPMPDHNITPSWTCPLVTWFDWSLGAFVAERFFNGRRAFERPAAWLAVLFALFLASTLFKPLTIFSFTLASATAAVVLDVALYIPWRRGRLVGFLAFVGTISYSLYLWHQPLLAPIVSSAMNLSGSAIAGWLALGPVVLAISWLSYLLVERPGISVGRSLWNTLFRRAAVRPAGLVDSTDVTLDSKKLAA
jgi:peptidoglycan/LPS O-acetylase OafA/YrhL